MTFPRVLIALFAALLASSATVTAQQPPTQPDSARLQIRTTLRAFYFNLAHHDWEAVTADILPAKVVAHRPAPESLVAAAGLPASTKCPAGGTALVDQAIIRLDGDWAEVTVPRCTSALAGADEFRLIHFEARWQVVHIDLFQESVNFSADR
jgi:hypothetical protein